MPLHSLELTLDDEGAAWVRRQWDLLVRAGLPSQARHTGSSNAPHVTLAAAPRVDRAQQDLASSVLAPHLPAALRMAGLVLFRGARRATLALLVGPPPGLASAVREVRGVVDEAPAGEWVPHVTLARRLTTEQATAALALVLAEPAPPAVRAVGLRHWDPDARRVTDLA